MYWKPYGASRGLWRVKCLELYPERLGRIKKTGVSVADFWAKFRTSDLTNVVHGLIPSLDRDWLFWLRVHPEK
jgi:hypothetical protein